jgi:hypothetical protein
MVAAGCGSSGGHVSAPASIDGGDARAASGSGGSSGGPAYDSGVVDAMLEAGTPEARPPTSCPAALSFFTDLNQAQCAADNCCMEFTACQQSADCLVVAACFAQCVAGAIGQSSADLCNMQCQADASATGSATFGSAYTCATLSGCLNPGLGDDAGSD